MKRRNHRWKRLIAFGLMIVFLLSSAEVLASSGNSQPETPQSSEESSEALENEGAVDEGVESSEAESSEAESSEAESSELESSEAVSSEAESGEAESSEAESSGVVSSEESTEAVPEKNVLLDIQEESAEENEPVPTVSYQTHVQTYGWQDWSADGAENGTTGLYKRLEGICIKVENTDLAGSIQYQTHVQSFGWQDPVSDGAVSGTTGLAKRLEGIKIWLTDELAEKYDVYYSVHIQSFGWSGWAKNGELAGTTGLVKRLEAIKIMLVRKGESGPSSGKPPFYALSTVSYRVHMQTYGWQDWKTNQQSAGITNEAKRLESIEIKLEGDTNLTAGIRYQTHVQSYGWQDWTQDGAANGTTGLAKRIEAIRIELTGAMATWADVYYRTYVEGYGWLGWAKNGETAGTEGLALRIQAIEINVIAKGGLNPGHGNSCKSYTGPGYYQIGSNRYYYSSNGMRRGGWQWSNGNRFYFSGGQAVTGWQYIDGYKYYFNQDGSLCQNVDSIIGVQSSYEIKINKQANCVTIYARDGANGYIIPVKSMLCSTGDDTPLGTIRTLAKYRWAAMYNGTYAQYATRLTPAPGVLFHSVTYSERGNNRSMLTEGYNGLGVVRSAGCVRLQCGDAYWIYTRCAVGTKVTVYNDSVAGPFDRPTVAKIPANQRWDPTDPAL